ncbi:unnamed protein product [Enterobius vermicularis]|uniref:WD repeat-containing protein 79 n=1 Tax=Enterobius vermicularis TaxID=51028 RepID=A0A0N4UUR5_ENTVE|nr:unnamed protein product [Enterobius vermicularis]
MLHDAEEVNALPRKKARHSVLFEFEKPKEVFREKEAFVTEARGFGFSLENYCNNYIKCCKWSSDGEILASSSQDRKVQLFKTLEDYSKVKLHQSIPLATLIYDICWHPSLSWLATSSKDQPIHCWNQEGKRAVSFNGINEKDELDSAYSLCFSHDGQQLYAGYNCSIRKFDINRGGRQQQDIKTWTKVNGGQKSIISCITMNPLMQGVYAAASYGQSIALYSDMSSGAECIFEVPSHAVTHIRYSSDGNVLFAASRKNDCITCWDLRYPGHMIGSLERPCTTNQRIYFEMDCSGRYLFSGSSSGHLYIFDVAEIRPELSEPVCVLPVHRSSLSGVSIHPNVPLVATCSGQRVFPLPDLCSEEENDDYETIRNFADLDNSLSLWMFSH